MKFTIIVAIVIAICVGGWLAFRNINTQPNQGTIEEIPEPIDTYKELRNKIFTSSAEEFNLSTKNGDEIYAVLMETGYPESVVTLVTILDGNASIYFGNGGGVIGGIDHENVRQEAIKMVNMANDFTKSMELINSYPYPNVGETKFYLLSTQGVFTTSAKEHILGEGNHALSPFFYQGHEVISQLRMTAGN